MAVRDVLAVLGGQDPSTDCPGHTAARELGVNWRGWQEEGYSGVGTKTQKLL